MRTMPSVTLTTVPSVRASDTTWNCSMRCLISSLISEGFTCCIFQYPLNNKSV